MSASTDVSSKSSSSDDARRAKCIRSVANMSSVKPNMLIDTKVFNPEILRQVIPVGAPKIAALLDKIRELDDKDMKKEKKVFKHMIFTDVDSSNYGAKLLASAFVADGYTPAFTNSLGLKSDETLMETKGSNFGLLISKSYGKKNMSTKFKKAQMHKYNERSKTVSSNESSLGNVQGDLIRFIILDQGFKEGIDLFDVKYVHLFEPLVSRADEKQAIGRSTRFCGQKGLEFHPRFGWPLYVYRYDLSTTGSSFKDARTLFELYLKYSNINMSRVVFAAELEKASIDAAVDKSLTSEVHSFKIDDPSPTATPTSASSSARSTPNSSVKKQSAGGRRDLLPPRSIMSLASMQNYVNLNFSKFKYPKVKLENLCGPPAGGGAAITFTPTQDFIRHFFQPSSAYKGMLLYHSVGSGKTCTAIATATTSFEKEGYNILWVTRHTLKSDIWKNMYDQVCSIDVQERLDSGKLKLKLPVTEGPMRYVSDKWIEPMSYKQFSNMLLKQNRFYETIVQRNGEKDPLRKTLIIIDEAHKLYAENVAASEKPQVEILEDMIQNSYKVSGKDSARVLLMTATPYTSDGMEMIKLLNLLRPKKEVGHFPTDFDKFTKAYLTPDGYFTKKGLANYQNEVSGYISYINRSQDARNFAHPVIENIHVPMSLKNKPKPDKHLDNEVKAIAERIKTLRAEVKEEKAALKDVVKDTKAKCAEEQKAKFADCKERVASAYDANVEAAKSRKEDGLNICKDVPKSEKKGCRDNVTQDYKNTLESLKQKKAQGQEDCKNVKKDCATGKAAALASLNKKVSELQTLLAQNKQSKDGVKAVLKDFQKNNKDMNQSLKELRLEAKEHRHELKALTEEMKALKVKLSKSRDLDERKPINDAIRELTLKIKEAKAPLDAIKVKITNLATNKKIARIGVGRAVIGDVSQETALRNRCFKDAK